MQKLLHKLKYTNIHTPRIALVRFLLAAGMLLTILFNDLGVIANHNYTRLPGYPSKLEAKFIPFRKDGLFEMMPPATAKIVVIVILLAVMSGFAPQITGVLHFWACFSVRSYFLVLNGGDSLALVLSVLLLPICFTDTRLNQWKHKERPPSSSNIVANIAMFVIFIQAALVYLDAGGAKLFVTEWQNGNAVYYYTSHYRLGAPDWLRHINEWLTLTPLVKLLTWGILALELAVALCVFFPARIRKKFFWPALFFHFLIVINFGLVTFFFSISALLILYLYDDSKRIADASSEV